MGRKERIAQIPPKCKRRACQEPITALPCVPRARQMWPLPSDSVFCVGGASTQRAASDFGMKASPGGDAAAAEQSRCL